MSLKDVALPGRIRQAGGATLKEAGGLFGWKPRSVTKTAADFTKDQLLAKGWRKGGCWMSPRSTSTSPGSRQRTRVRLGGLHNYKRLQNCSIDGI